MSLCALNDLSFVLSSFMNWIATLEANVDTHESD